MIPETKAKEIRRLLGRGLSQRNTADLTGISRATVGLIASGERPDYSRRERWQRQPEFKAIDEPIRCTGCGGRICLVPCPACRLSLVNA